MYYENGYQGWSNSATWSCAYLIQQEQSAYKAFVAIRKSGKLVTGDDIKREFKRLNLKKDSWTKGPVNWQEIADDHYNGEDFV